MKHHGAHEEDDQRAILEEHPDAFRLAAFLAVIRAPRPLVIDLIGADDEQD